METNMPHLTRPLTDRSARFFCTTLAAVFAATSAALADPISELASFSVLRKSRPGAADRRCQAVRGPGDEHAASSLRATAWVTPGTPAQQAEAMRRWNPASHSELKILLHTNGSNFSRLADAPNSAAVQALATSTLSKSTDLQISRDEAAKLPGGTGGGMSGPVASFWSTVLSARAAAGPFGQPPYDHTGESVRAGDEINGLLRGQPKIQKQFSGLIGGKGDQYWELLEVESKGVLTLGASYSRQASGGSYQFADVLYYASGGYYAAVTLYQMWPIEVGGKPSTLVWRGDMISSASVGELRGVERMGSETSMMRNISRAVRLFRRDTGGGR
jgi:hypothetical protein